MEVEINYRWLRKLAGSCPYLLLGEVEEGDIALCKVPEATVSDLDDKIEFGKVKIPRCFPRCACIYVFLTYVYMHDRCCT